jgi:hypothetical protein
MSEARNQRESRWQAEEACKQTIKHGDDHEREDASYLKDALSSY